MPGPGGGGGGLAIGPMILLLFVPLYNSAQAQVWGAGGPTRGEGACSEVHTVLSCVRHCGGWVCDS